MAPCLVSLIATLKYLKTFTSRQLTQHRESVPIPPTVNKYFNSSHVNHFGPDTCTVHRRSQTESESEVSLDHSQNRLNSIQSTLKSVGHTKECGPHDATGSADVDGPQFAVRMSCFPDSFRSVLCSDRLHWERFLFEKVQMQWNSSKETRLRVQTTTLRAKDLAFPHWSHWSPFQKIRQKLELTIDRPKFAETKTGAKN